MNGPSSKQLQKHVKIDESNFAQDSQTIGLGIFNSFSQDSRVNSQAKFGTDGIRGKVGTVLTPHLALELGYWCGHVLRKDAPIIIGQDSRQSGAMLSAALTAGLTAAGKEVWNIGLCPTPAVSALIKKFNAGGGIMVSASHNPPEDNGIKIFGENACKLNAEQQKLIEKQLLRQQHDHTLLSTFTSCGKSYERHELISFYQEDVINSLSKRCLEDVSIVLDLCWGSATSCAEELFSSLGANLSIINGIPNGKKINVNCGSTNLDSLRKVVLEKGADMGFAFDGDADRMLAVDKKGRLLDGDHILYLWGSSLLERNNLPHKMLVSTVMSNLGFEEAWKSKGGLLERTPVGDKYVYAAMVESGAALGGEQSGHIISIENSLNGDGLFAALQIATLCNAKNKSLTEWRDESFTAFPQKLINVKLPRQLTKEGLKSCKPLNEAVSNAQSDLGEEGRILIRPSGTEPLLRVMVEARDPKKVNALCKYLANLIEQSVNS